MSSPPLTAEELEVLTVTPAMLNRMRKEQNHVGSISPHWGKVCSTSLTREIHHSKPQPRRPRNTAWPTNSLAGTRTLCW